MTTNGMDVLVSPEAQIVELRQQYQAEKARADKAAQEAEKAAQSAYNAQEHVEKAGEYVLTTQRYVAGIEDDVRKLGILVKIDAAVIIAMAVVIGIMSGFIWLA